MSRNVVEQIVVELLGEGSQYGEMLRGAVAQSRGAMQSVQKSTQGVENAAARSGANVTSFFRKFSSDVMGYASVLAGVVGVGGIISSIRKGLSLANEAESNEIAFGTMLKSAEKGKKMVEDLQILGAKTPMSTGSLQQAAKTMLQFGVAGENVLPILTMLGNAVGGSAEKLQSMSRAFGQMSSTGRLQGDELNQMIDAGFNPLQEMSEDRAKMKGGTAESHMPKLKKEMEAGKISVNSVIEAFKRSSAEGGKFAGLMEKQANSVTGLFSTMQDDIDGVLRVLGKSLHDAFDTKGFLKQVSSAAGALKGWLEGISPETKQAFASFVTAVGVIGGIVAGVFALKAAIGVAFALAPLWPFILAIGVGVAIVYKLIQSVGGVAAAFAVIKEKALAAWAWTAPVRSALMLLWQSIVEGGEAAWSYLVDAATEAWAYIKGNATTTWASVRDTIIDALISAEFFFRNLKSYAELAWLGMKLGAIVAFNEVVYNLTEVLPSALAYFAENWEEILSVAWTWAVDAVALTIQNIVGLVSGTDWATAWMSMEDSFESSLNWMFNNFQRIMTAIATAGLSEVGGLNFADLWGEKAKEGAEKAAAEVKKIPKMAGGVELPPYKVPDRVPTEVENKIRDQFDKLKGTLGQDYQDFRDEKLADIYAQSLPESAVDKAAETGLKMGKAVEDGVKKGISKVDASLVGSAEAVAKLAAYQDMLNETSGDKFGIRGDQKNFAERKKAEQAETQRKKNYEFGVKARREDAGSASDPNPTLKDILNELKKGNEKPGLNLEGAGFA